MTNTKQMLITPICPITTLAGNRDLELAAFIMLGPRKDEPMPATEKEIERIMMVRVWFFVPRALTATMPAINETPEVNEAARVRYCIE
jgi:hypothetical protein